MVAQLGHGSTLLRLRLPYLRHQLQSTFCLKKRSWFLQVRRFHSSQGNKGLVIPAGGRVIILLLVSIKFRIVEVEACGLCSARRRSQTFSAKGHWKIVWISLLIAPQRLQVVVATIPLLPRASQTGSALFASFHKKIFSLGEVSTFQIHAFPLN